MWLSVLLFFLLQRRRMRKITGRSWHILFLLCLILSNNSIFEISEKYNEGLFHVQVEPFKGKRKELGLCYSISSDRDIPPLVSLPSSQQFTLEWFSWENERICPHPGIRWQCCSFTHFVYITANLGNYRECHNPKQNGDLICFAFEMYRYKLNHLVLV